MVFGSKSMWRGAREDEYKGKWCHSYDYYIDVKVRSLEYMYDNYGTAIPVGNWIGLLQHRPDGTTAQRKYWEPVTPHNICFPFTDESDLSGDTDVWAEIKNDLGTTVIGFSITTKDQVRYCYTKSIIYGYGRSRWLLGSIKYPSGSEVKLGYDSSNRLTSVCDPDLQRYLYIEWGAPYIKTVWSQRPYGCYVATQLKWVGNSLTVNYPELDSVTDQPYASWIADPSYPVGQTPFYNYAKKWAEVTVDGNMYVTKVGVPAGSSDRARDDWRISYYPSIYTAYITEPAPAGRKTTVTLKRSPLGNAGSNTVSAGELRVATVCDPRGDKTQYRHARWLGHDGEDAPGANWYVNRTYSLDARHFDRDYWLGFRLYDISREEADSAGRKAWVTLEEYN